MSDDVKKETVELKLQGQGIKIKANLTKEQAGQIISIALKEKKPDKDIGFHK